MSRAPYILGPNDPFPFPYEADEDDLVAIGGGFSVERLLQAYSIGLFPWFEEQGWPYWFSPNPRCVLYPHQLKISKSMQALLKKKAFTVTINTQFKQVMNACANVQRKGDHSSWISPLFIDAYYQLHLAGYACSVEVWNQKGELAGGLYGVKWNTFFFGESMFSLESNASKYGFIEFVEILIKEGIELIDCQQETPHLKSLGAISIDRNTFLQQLRQAK